MRLAHGYVTAHQLGLALVLGCLSARAQSADALEKRSTPRSRAEVADRASTGSEPSEADAAPAPASMPREPEGTRRPPSVTPEEASAAITKAPWPAVPASSSPRVDPPPSLAPIASSGPPTSSAAAADDGVVALDDGLMGTHQAHFYFAAGARVTKISDAAYDPFATQDALAQVSLGLGNVLYRRGSWSTPVAIAWDYGAATAQARGAETSLRSHRFVVVPELRRHFFRRLYAFAKLGLGVSLVNARLEDVALGSERSSESVGFTADPALGVAFEVAGARAGYSREPRLWLALEGGYVWTTSTRLRFEPASGAPARTADVDLGELSLSGPSTRLSAALSF